MSAAETPHPKTTSPASTAAAAHEAPPQGQAQPPAAAAQAHGPAHGASHGHTHAHAQAHPVERRSAEEQRRLDAAQTRLFEELIRFNSVIGLKVLSLDPAGVRIGFDMRDELIGHYQHHRLHGGVISATLDALGGLALMVAIAERHPADNTAQVMQRFTRMGTIDLRVDYLRQGLARRYEAQAEVLRLGGRVGTVSSRLYDPEGLLIATATAAYMVA